LKERTLREQAIDALTLQPPGEGLVPHAELEMQLTQEFFGREYLSEDFKDETAAEKDRILSHNAELLLEVGERFGYCFLMAPPERVAKMSRMAPRKHLYIWHGDATYSIPSGADMQKFALWLFEKPDEAKRQAEQSVTSALEAGKRAMDLGMEGFALCADYCFNNGPFLSPGMFAEFVTPFLARLIQGYRDLGAYVIKHTDGDIMPIIDQLVGCRPHALHSLDPMAGVDIAAIKRRYGKELCLIGNVNCALMQTGSDEDVRRSAAYALESGMPGGGYVFSTSNVIFKGLPPERYLLMLKVREELGRYGKDGSVQRS
jgi:uroporphyrinogen decarboxylase